jgi:hypothetical protein
MHHLAAGCGAGAITACCTNPIWVSLRRMHIRRLAIARLTPLPVPFPRQVVKTRMQTQLLGSEGAYRGLLRTHASLSISFLFVILVL